MKKIYLLAFVLFAFRGMTSAQTSHIIITSGFAYSPDSVHANVGDTIVFNCNFGVHPLQEVSSTTWTANGTAPLSGGFSASSGSTFSVVMAQAGTRYYVCVNHVASMGMKGRIVVSPANGIENVPSLVVLPYPNPARNVLHIAGFTAGNVNYTLTDMLGQNILHGFGSGEMSLDVSAIAEGNYILSTTNSEGLMTKNKIDIRR